MKNLRKMVMLILTLAMLTTGVQVSVLADQTTDLQSMKVYAVNAAGKKTKAELNFSSTTYTYDITVMSDTESIEIVASPATSGSTWAIEKDGINTKMDFGKNYTAVVVTSSTGAKNKYEINTTKLTEAEQATYKAGSSTDETTAKDSSSTSSKKSKKASKSDITVGKGEYKIVEDFKDDLIPEGFSKTKAEYDGKQYEAIKGDKKDITAFYLKKGSTKGFYIYDYETKKFSSLRNIKIASRMYTVVNPSEKASCLKKYTKKQITVIDQEVNAWVLNEEEGLYLLYAMNWNGDTNLYCYDDNEKCFQRYIAEDDVNTQIEAANKAYNNVKNKYNTLASKYNMLLKIACGLVIVIIILIFVIINIKLNRKEKRLAKQKKYDDKNNGNGKDKKDAEDSTESNEIEPMEEQVKEIEEPEYVLIPETVEEPEVLDEVVEDFPEADDVEIPQVEEATDLNQDVVLDLDDIEDAAETTEDEIEKESEKAQLEAEEDMKETLKDMLPDDDEDDEDFEFIDLD